MTHDDRVLELLSDGDLEALLERRPLLFASNKIEERFLFKVRERANGCWEWQGSKSPAGYGAFQFQGSPRGAHRVMFMLFYGEEALGDLHVDHLCRNTSCVHPLHLEAVTQAENNRRAHLRTPRRRKTHCKHGHPLSGPNAGTRSDGKGVYCRTCNRASCARYWRRQRAAAASA